MHNKYLYDNGFQERATCFGTYYPIFRPLKFFALYTTMFLLLLLSPFSFTKNVVVVSAHKIVIVYKL